MLSPGEFYKQVPKDPVRNRRFRVATLRRALTDRTFQKALLLACKEDVLFWINTFVFQFNPNAIGGGSEEIGPFVTWDFQDDAVRQVLDCVEDRRDLVIEKSREMGASWLCLLVVDWAYLFHDWKKFLVISRNEEAVDRPEDSDCLFWKLDFVHQHLPDWMAAGRVTRRKLGFRNPLTRSSVTGQATTGKAGVGGRATAMFIDEYSQIKEDYEVLHRTSDTTGCRIFNGTHLGEGTAFFEITQRVDMRKLRMHWTQHPDKRRGLYRYSPDLGRVELLDGFRGNCKLGDTSYRYPEEWPFITDGTPTGGPFSGLRSPWYDDQCRRKGSARAVAMDLDIDPKGSVSQFFDQGTIRELIRSYVTDPLWEGDIHFDRDTGKPFELIAVEGGPLKLWCRPDRYGKPPLARYGAGTDVAAGTGATNSCLSLGNAGTGEKAAEYANPRIDPKDFALVAVAVCRLFVGPDGAPALLAWEVQGPGTTFGNKVLEVGYRNVYWRTNEFALSKKTTDTPGWYPSPENALALLHDYRAALFTRRLINRSKIALEECLNFKFTARGDIEHAGIESKGDPTGARINHGDRTVADALMWKMCLVLGAGKTDRAQEEERREPSSIAGRRERHLRRQQLAEAY